MAFYTLVVIELATRRVQIVGCTPHPDEAFMAQAARTMTVADEGALAGCRVLICDRDQKWSAAVRHLLEESKVHVVQTPFRAPNCNAHAERFVRSVKEECLNRVIPLGSGRRCTNSSNITTTNAIIRASTTSSSTAIRFA